MLVVLAIVWNEHVKTNRIIWKDFFTVVTVVNHNTGIVPESFQKKLADHGSLLVCKWTSKNKILKFICLMWPTMNKFAQLNNSFVSNAPFLYRLKTSENLTVSWCFQGVEKGCIGNEWVNMISWLMTFLASSYW